MPDFIPEDETVSWSGRPSVQLLVRPALILPFVILFVLLVLVFTPVKGLLISIGMFKSAIGLYILILGILGSGIVLEKYYVTDQAVYKKLGTSYDRIAYSDITGVSGTEESSLGTNLGYGDVTITSQEAGSKTLRGVRNPSVVADTISRQLD